MAYSFRNTSTPTVPSTPWTTLTASLDASTVTVPVASKANLPASFPFTFSVDSEYMLATASAGALSYTVTRGAEGSTAATHASGAGIFHILTAEGLNNLPYAPTTRTVNGSPLSADVTVSTITGNAGTATALQTPRNINGVPFDGTANITLPAGSVLWGDITGTLADQADLQTALDGKLSATLPGADAQIVYNDGGSLGTDAQLTWVEGSGLRMSGKAAFGTGTFNQNIYTGGNLQAEQFMNVRGDFTFVPTDGITRRATGLWTQATVTPSGVKTGTTNHAAFGAYLERYGSHPLSHLTAGQFYCQQIDAAATTSLDGIEAYVDFYGGTYSSYMQSGGFESYDEVNGVDVIAHVAIIEANGSTSWSLDTRSNYFGAGTLPEAGGLRVGVVGKSGAGTITTVYGVKVADQTAGATNYAIYTGVGAVRFGGALTVVGAISGSNLSGTNTGDQDLSGYVTPSSAAAFTNKTGNISQWTNDSGYLLSVTAHNLLSATHGDTTAGSVARGDLVTGQGASAKWTRLAKGTANQVLAMDGTATDVLWVTPSAGVAWGAITGTLSGQTDLQTALNLALPKAGGTLTGALLFSTDNTLDIGASGATRPRSIYVATNISCPTFTVNTTDSRFWAFGATTRSDGEYAWTSTSNGVSGTIDVKLVRDGSAGVMAQKLGAAAQEFRIYGTTTGSKYLSLKHDGTNPIIGSSSGGLKANSTAITPASTGTRYLIIDTAGNITSSASAPSGT